MVDVFTIVFGAVMGTYGFLRLKRRRNVNGGLRAVDWFILIWGYGGALLMIAVTFMK